MLVNMLFPRRRLALLAALLFAFGVGSYGRVFSAIHQQENLLLAGLHLLVMYAFIRNDFRHGGSVLSPVYVLGLGLFLLTGLTRATSFSLVGALIAYKAFFYRFRGRRIVTADVLIFLAGRLGVLLGPGPLGVPHAHGVHRPASHPTLLPDVGEEPVPLPEHDVLSPAESPLLKNAPFWVEWAYEARTVIRTLLALAIVSYSFFGFVFGSRAIRFFIAWTFITVLPFTDQSDAGSG